MCNKCQSRMTILFSSHEKVLKSSVRSLDKQSHPRDLHAETDRSRLGRISSSKESLETDLVPSFKTYPMSADKVNSHKNSSSKNNSKREAKSRSSSSGLSSKTDQIAEKLQKLTEKLSK